MNEFVKEIASAMKESKTKPYDTVAEVLRVDEKTAYVHIDGGADETPAQMAINCKAGDSVKIRVSGGRAWLTGNLTSPPTDDTAAEKVKQSHERFKKGTVKNFGLQNGKIINAAKTATNFIDYIDGVGLIVGDMRGNTLKQNTLLDSNGMAVRNGSNEIVRFGTAPIVITNTDGDKTYEGSGSVMQSDRNIVVSTQQTNPDDIHGGGKAALELYYDKTKDTTGLSLTVKEGSTYSDLYESMGTGIHVDNNHIQIVSNDVECILGKNNILWDANTIGYWMLAEHKFTLNEPISMQPTGAVFVWSHYSNEACDNWWWTTFFVPKQHVAWRPGDGMLMSNPYYGLNKYLYIGDTFIQGTDGNKSNNAQNGIAVNNQGFVLRYVLGV
ncbi:Hypothetical protein EHLA_2170 [Anaerobutyricum hallii]|uniref:Uncharacterized protein n=1 Tax=Anaerobutyricum hallii TaxID=39488 RepID=A0A285PT54_9FIRM|nr:hypothetical protein [Anaerobutyricum hallii]SOB72801.1 Hypothetical protein EHLA_2170 [Anaerobutyricum hallii]